MERTVQERSVQEHPVQERLVHGGDIYRHPGALDFSSNINPLGTPESVIRAACDSMKEISSYPDVLQEKLLAKLSVYEKVPQEQLICGNGAAEVIFSFVHAVRPETALVTAPSFAEYEGALQSADCEIRYHILEEKNGFRLTEAFLDALTPDLDMAFLCNPNNPTGCTIDPDLMKRILERCRDHGIWLLVDECFQDFLDDPHGLSVRDELDTHPQLFILKAFTKRYAVPGIRLGYGLSANAELLEAMHRIVQPWNVSVPAQAAGAAALDEEAYVEEARALIRKERAFLKEELEKLGFRVFDSKANYIFFRGPAGLQKKTLEKQVLIRDCSNYRGLEEGYYRVAVRRHEENLCLLDALA